MGYSAKAVANYFLSNFGKHGITPMKIQKLVYISHGWNYAFSDDDLINDERPEAWPYGPVFPSLYIEFRYRGKLPIIKLARELDFEKLERGDVVSYEPKIRQADGKTQNLLDEIWNSYGVYSGTQLSEVCHKKGSPWHRTRQEQPGIRNAHIPNPIIKEHYRKLYKETQSPA